MTMRGWMALVVLGCVAGACGPEEKTPGTPDGSKVSTTRGALNSAFHGPVWRGHELVTMKAATYLARRGLLAPVLQQNQWYGVPIDLLNYGNDFADHPWLGWPASPTTPIANHMTANVPPGRYEWARTQESFDITVPASVGDVTATVTGIANLSWVGSEPGRPSTSMRYGLTLVATPNASFGWLANLVGALSLGFYEPPDLSSQVFPQEFAVDNYYHYALGDMHDVRGPGGETPQAVGDTIRIFPMYGWHAATGDPEAGITDYEEYLSWPSEKRAIADGIAARMQNQAVLAGADYGVAKYGAIIYQLARKFFSGARAEPDLAELIKAGNDVPGWRTGYMQGTGDIGHMHLDMPHTYLGGMPHICSGSTSVDPCAEGQPTWPPWITTSSDFSYRENPRPGQSDLAATIYLGWATHLIQDAAVPHHASNWSGKEHGKQDALGDFLGYYASAWCDDYTGDCFDVGPPALDATATAEIDALLGPEWNPKDRRDICRSVGIIDSQVQPGRLDWETVYPLFLETMWTAIQSRQEQLDPSQEEEAGRQIVKNAVLATIKLLLCAVPGIDTGWNDNRKDFNGDLYTDVLWRNEPYGVTGVWDMNGTDIVGWQDLSPAYTGTLYNVVGTGDFDRDGQTDVLWQNKDNGAFEMWHMSGATLDRFAEVEQNLLPWLGWFFKGIGDFNRDGYPDFLIYHPESGWLMVWSMVDSELVAADYVTGAQVPASWGWEIRGTGDFDRDGYTDIVWWHPSSGQISIWFMNGHALRDSGIVNQNQFQSVGWELKGTGDFNRDGYPDLLWHNQTTAEVAAWFLKGMTFMRSQTLSWAGSDWAIVSH
jgi:hypothetical protein